MTDQYVPMHVVAKKFSVNVTTVRGWILRDVIPRDTYIKIGKFYRFDLDKLIDSLQQAEGDTPAPTWSDMSDDEDSDIPTLVVDEDY